MGSMREVARLTAEVEFLKNNLAEVIRRLQFVMTSMERVQAPKIIGGEPVRINLLDSYMAAVRKAAEVAAEAASQLPGEEKSLVTEA